MQPCNLSAAAAGRGVRRIEDRNVNQIDPMGYAPGVGAVLMLTATLSTPRRRKALSYQQFKRKIQPVSLLKQLKESTSEPPIKQKLD